MSNKLRYFWFGLSGFVFGLAIFFIPPPLNIVFSLSSYEYLVNIIPNSIFGFFLIGIPYILIAVSILGIFLRLFKECHGARLWFPVTLFAGGGYLVNLGFALFLMFAFSNWQPIL
ncbi:MAG: hypothetical protein A3B23_01440 [Candidatus Colwellbacteria bacterium RIFCSPLOWO2_01_FULL_48_10]|uniref:Uncharacterized protein n=2 Tax=Bacteria candidate phyla TaxID=1783234 RepID=A0A1F5P3L7_9BACT|nr:MAG: hypothetical protein A2846_04255 [Candidatus Doudnabacteria bacterium RIFCSPHIGHO2_01_FULL_49_9]OGY59075.1 MAG: hypothetical protein A3B23_01440 [Candidatus Colwellbacteria bacterium RIFCSPLOWO2_01_FULL_48_10]